MLCRKFELIPIKIGFFIFLLIIYFQSIQNHEKGLRHKGNVEKQLREVINNNEYINNNN